MWLSGGDGARRIGSARVLGSLWVAAAAATLLAAATGPIAESAARPARSLARAGAAPKVKVPKNLSKPLVSGAPTAGRAIAATAGSWANDPTAYGYEWEACSSKGKSCRAIAGATGSSYVIENAEIGSTLRVAVTASNAAGSKTADSAVTPLVTAGAPVDEVPPAVSGQAREGAVLTAIPGTWSGTQPISYAYSWQRCREATCANVGSGSTYTPTEADIGSTIQLEVTATNSAGSTRATSSPTATVLGNAPEELAPPAIGGRVAEGALASASAGTWKGTAPISYSYSWQECAPSNPESEVAGAERCVPIAARAAHRCRCPPARSVASSASRSRRPTPTAAFPRRHLTRGSGDCRAPSAGDWSTPVPRPARAMASSVATSRTPQGFSAATAIPGWPKASPTPTTSTARNSIPRKSRACRSPKAQPKSSNSSPPLSGAPRC